MSARVTEDNLRAIVEDVDHELANQAFCMDVLKLARRDLQIRCDQFSHDLEYSAEALAMKDLQAEFTASAKRVAELQAEEDKLRSELRDPDDLMAEMNRMVEKNETGMKELTEMMIKSEQRGDKLLALIAAFSARYDKAKADGDEEARKKNFREQMDFFAVWKELKTPEEKDRLLAYHQDIIDGWEERKKEEERRERKKEEKKEEKN